MKKKVVFCESGYNRFYGAQQSLYNFLINADKNNLDMVALCPGNGVLTEKLEERNIEVDIVNYPKELNKTGEELKGNNVLNKIKIFFGFIKYVKRYIQYFKKNKVDLVYCNDIRSILTCGLAAKICRIPVIWYVRIDKDLGIFNHIGVNIADHIILIANNVKRIFNERYIIGKKNRFSTIYTGIDLNNIDNIYIGSRLRDLSLDENINLVGMIASIQPRKGQKDLINSIVQLRNDNPSLIEKTRFLIVGDTLSSAEKEYLQGIKEIIKKNNLTDYIYFLGWRKDIISIMKQLDLLVLPSYSEGLPRTVLESLSCNCPVIATDIAGTSEIVEHKKNGMLIQPGDIEGLAAALEYMLEDQQRLKQYGIKGRRTIENRFRIEKYVQELEAILIDKAK